MDFTNLDLVLFEAKVPTAAIFVQKEEHNEEKPITHITIRRTKTNEDKIFFEIDKYDFHYVSQLEAIDNKHIWKCNLLGGGRLHNLVSRLSESRTVEDFRLKQKWEVGEGYIDSKSAKPVDYLSNKDFLHADGLTEDGINENYIEQRGVVCPHRKTNEHIFEPPLILIKENIGKNRRKIPIGLSEKYLTFRSTIIGISASKSENSSSLIDFYKDFKKYNDVFRLYISATSNQFLVTRGTLLYKQDLMNLPYPEDKEELQLSYIEQILCEDVLDYYIQIKSESSKATMNKPANQEDLEKYGEVFCKLLNSVYGKSEKSFYLNKISDWGDFYITEFNYGSEKKETGFEKIDELAENLKSLITNELGRNFLLQRIIRVNERNKFSFIKPKSLRYWLRSIAIKDADEVFSGLVKAGY